MDSTFFGSTRLLLDSSKFSIFISRQQVDTTLRKLHQEIAWSKFLICEMLQLRSLVFDELDVERSNLDVKLNTLCLESQDGNLILDAAELPVLIRVIHATGLQQSNWSKLGG